MWARRTKGALAALVLLGSLVALTVGATPVSAGGPIAIVVTVTGDVVNGNTTPGDISLREAVNLANGDGFTNTIVLGTDQTYQLTDCASEGNEDEDANANGDLDLLEPANSTIDGNGSTIEQTCDQERVLSRLGTSNLTVQEVAITGGDIIDGDGGGVMANGVLTIRDGSSITGNVTFGDGGGAWSGGAMSLLDSSISDNVTFNGGGGGVFAVGDVVLNRSTVHDNRSFTGTGGIGSDNDVYVRNSTVSHNLAENNGGIVADLITLEYATVYANSGRQGQQSDNLNPNDVDGLSAFASIIGLGGPSGDCDVDPEDVVSLGFNLGFDETCSGLDHPTDLPGTYPHVNVPGSSDAADEGGLGHAPVEPSRAIDRIPPICGAGADDQREVSRPVGDGCDAGALEVDPDPCGPTFDDVGVGNQFFEEICWMAQIGISTGFPDETFKPTAPVTRQAMSAFIYRLAGAPPYDPQGETFNDVSDAHPFYAEIEWMAETGIASGFDGDLFQPGANVSRQAMSAFMYRVAGEPTFFPAGQTFTDVSPAHPFYKEVEWMADEGISTGFEGGTYRPGIPVSRQAMSAFMLRLAESVPLAGV